MIMVINEHFDLFIVKASWLETQQLYRSQNQGSSKIKEPKHALKISFCSTTKFQNKYYSLLSWNTSLWQVYINCE